MQSDTTQPRQSCVRKASATLSRQALQATTPTGAAHLASTAGRVHQCSRTRGTATQNFSLNALLCDLVSIPNAIPGVHIDATASAPPVQAHRPGLEPRIKGAFGANLVSSRTARSTGERQHAQS